MDKYGNYAQRMPVLIYKLSDKRLKEVINVLRNYIKNGKNFVILANRYFLKKGVYLYWVDNLIDSLTVVERRQEQNIVY